MIKDLKNHKLSRNFLAEKYGYDTEDIRAFRRILKIQNKPTGKIEGKGLALWDYHYPEHDPACKKIVEEFLIDYQPDYLILGGDQLDMGCISIYNKGRVKLLENKRLYKDYEGFQHDILDYFADHLPRDCKRVFITGNHEYRIDRLLETDPHFIGLIELEHHLDLDGWEVVPFNGVYTLGSMNFIHGMYWNKFHARKTLEVFDDNVFYGHVHETQIYSKPTPINNEPKIAHSVGCLCNKNPDYMRDKPNRWVHEFLSFTVFGNGDFSPHINRIINGRVEINGKVYNGRE